MEGKRYFGAGSTSHAANIGKAVACLLRLSCNELL